MRTLIFSFLILLFLALSVSAQNNETQQIDEFENPGCDDYLARMDSAIIQAQNNPASNIYVLVYEGRETRFDERKEKPELIFPAFGLAEAKISSMKKYVMRFKVSANQFVFINAGFRARLSVEFWFVPNGAVPPKAAPTLTKIKHRKGKPKGFCLICCGYDE